MFSSLPQSARPGRVPAFVYGLAGVIGFLAVLFFLARGSGPAESGIILYWGIGCPHCEKVEEFLQANKVEQVIEITKKEVYQNQKNAYEMGKHAGVCGLPTDSVAVPLLWTGQQCLIGDVDIIGYFRQALGMESSSAGQ